ncbi:MAG: hypothetical protein ABSF62_02510 [Bryobacteraceae bacterium]|jgi:hypothetical protein
MTPVAASFRPSYRRQVPYSLPAANFFGPIKRLILAGAIPHVSQHSKRSIRILNPVPGGRTHTTRRSAARYIDQGRARMTAGNLEFFSDDHRHQAVLMQASAKRPHSIKLRIVLRADYRGEVLGLPNFCGFIKDQAIHGKLIAA